MLRTGMLLLMLIAAVALLTGCPKPTPPSEAPAVGLGEAPPPSATPPPAEKLADEKSAEEKPADNEGSKVKVEGEEGKPVEKTASGLQYVVLDEGTGAKPAKGEKVIAEYTGWLTDGTKFDSSKDHPGEFDFNVGAGNVIPGWDEAFAGMKEGERRKLIIPAELGYGEMGTPGGPIPPNATLIFEVKLVKIVK